MRTYSSGRTLGGGLGGHLGLRVGRVRVGFRLGFGLGRRALLDDGGRSGRLGLLALLFLLLLLILGLLLLLSYQRYTQDIEMLSIHPYPVARDSELACKRGLIPTFTGAAGASTLGASFLDFLSALSTLGALTSFLPIFVVVFERCIRGGSREGEDGIREREDRWIRNSLPGLHFQD